MSLEELYQDETGKKAMVEITDGVHRVAIKVYSKDFVEWLKNIVSRKQRQINELLNEFSAKENKLPLSSRNLSHLPKIRMEQIRDESLNRPS
jgi:hypothetical protein